MGHRLSEELSRFAATKGLHPHELLDPLKVGHLVRGQQLLLEGAEQPLLVLILE